MKNGNKGVIDIDLRIKADSILFFDLDGTLVDTDYANFLSYKKAIEFVKKMIVILPSIQKNGLTVVY